MGAINDKRIPNQVGNDGTFKVLFCVLDDTSADSPATALFILFYYTYL